MMIENVEGLKVFEVHLSIPPDDKFKWRRNATVYAVANSAERAIALAVQEFPGSSVWQLTHRGAWNNNRVVIDND